MNTSPDATCPAGQRVISRIKAEHRALARVIAAMQAWVVRSREPRAGADPELFEAMLRYVREVPDRIHHPQEDAVLFPAVAKAPGGARVISELEREHATGGPMLEAVGRAHGLLQAGAPNALNALSTAVDEFAEFYWAHMRKEEEELLPIAMSALTEDQWNGIDRDFQTVNDPLFDSAPAEGYRQLFRFIAERTTGPLKGFVEDAAVRRT